MATEFTPWMSFLGGALIGLSALLMMAAHGRIAGISGILSRWLTGTSSPTSTNTAFLCGLLLGLPVTAILMGGTPTVTIDAPFPMMLIAGLLVGYGTVTGSGCTSGHGVCGMSRLSSRSMIATATFMLSAVITLFFVRHVFGG